MYVAIVNSPIGPVDVFESRLPDADDLERLSVSTTSYHRYIRDLELAVTSELLCHVDSTVDLLIYGEAVMDEETKAMREKKIGSPFFTYPKELVSDMNPEEIDMFYVLNICGSVVINTSEEEALDFLRSAEPSQEKWMDMLVKLEANIGRVKLEILGIHYIDDNPDIFPMDLETKEELYSIIEHL